MSEQLQVTFVGEHGEMLSGRLHLAAGRTRAFALFAHCFTCSKDLRAAVTIARELAAQGISVLRFDFTGLGQSGGEFSDTTFASNIGDVVAAAGFLRDNYQAPSLLVGHSLGGAAVLLAASQMPEVKAVATIGAPSEPIHVEHLFEDSRANIEAQGSASVSIGGRPFIIKKQFVDDLGGHAELKAVASLKRALLVCHSPTDQIVGVASARKIYEAAKHPKSFVSLDDADHLLSKAVDAEYAAKMISTWASRYVDTPEGPWQEQSGDVQVRIDSGFAVEIANGRHRLQADEPLSVGGSDSGPTPYGFLLSALGACTAITMRMYADRKGYALESAQIALSHQKIHAQECQECETETGKVDRITRKITLVGELSEQEQQAILRIANRCPVHRTLHSEVSIKDAD